MKKVFFNKRTRASSVNMNFYDEYMSIVRLTMLDEPCVAGFCPIDELKLRVVNGKSRIIIEAIDEWEGLFGPMEPVPPWYCRSLNTSVKKRDP